MTQAILNTEQDVLAYMGQYERQGGGGGHQIIDALCDLQPDDPAAEAHVDGFGIWGPQHGDAYTCRDARCERHHRPGQLTGADEGTWRESEAASRARAIRALFAKGVAR